MELNYEDIGRRVRALRRARGLSQEQLAELTDLSVVHISHIETAHTKLSLPALVGVANALSVTADALLCDNLDRAAEPFRGEIADAVRDCTEAELRVMADVLRALKQSLRRRLPGGN